VPALQLDCLTAFFPGLIGCDSASHGYSSGSGVGVTLTNAKAIAKLSMVKTMYVHLYFHKGRLREKLHERMGDF